MQHEVELGKLSMSRTDAEQEELQSYQLMKEVKIFRRC